jgi:tol-pal system protein YbgF
MRRERAVQLARIDLLRLLPAEPAIFLFREMLMYFRTILSGTLAAMLISVAAVRANDRSAPIPDQGVVTPFKALSGIFGTATDDGSFQVAQASDPRVGQLEEQLRKLNGTVEDLNFQILQLQEQLRKIQEDYDFRLQELEKKSDASGKKTPKVAGDGTRPPAPDQTASDPNSVEGVIAGDTAKTTMDGNGEPAKTFGVITVDKDGNVKSVESPGANVAAGGMPPAAGNSGTGTDNGGSIVAALPKTEDAEELYRNSYQLILSGDYSTAESGFRDHIARFPKSERAADAHFWLGEALLGQKKYRDAAETFLAAGKQYPKARKAPDTMLKLGISLAGLQQKEVACATFGEVTKRYPNASAALKERVKQEQALASC